MKNTIKFSSVVSACGPVLRARVEIGGENFDLEMNAEKTWLNITRHEQPGSGSTQTETCVIDADGDVIAEGGEYVTEKWSDADWAALTEAVGAK